MGSNSNSCCSPVSTWLIWGLIILGILILLGLLLWGGISSAWGQPPAPGPNPPYSDCSCDDFSSDDCDTCNSKHKHSGRKHGGRRISRSSECDRTFIGEDGIDTKSHNFKSRKSRVSGSNFSSEDVAELKSDVAHIKADIAVIKDEVRTSDRSRSRKTGFSDLSKTKEEVPKEDFKPIGRDNEAEIYDDSSRGN